MTSVTKLNNIPTVPSARINWWQRWM